MGVLFFKILNSVFHFFPMFPNKQNTSKGIMGKKLNKNLPNALSLIEPLPICFTQIRPALDSTLL